MTAELRDTLARVLLPGVAIAVILFVARLRGMSFRDDLGLQLPSWKQGLFWLILFVVLAAIEEVLQKIMGLPAPERWGAKYTAEIKAVRVFAIAVLAPLSEELLFRGMLYRMIEKTVLGRVGAIAITSAAFAALHYQYGVRGLPFTSMDGVFFGMVRCSTRSTILTIFLHALGNSYAAYQRL
ncbi:MAG: hypothetical protein DMG39_27935 [Acidobacteria bacterium]|nr:MAG: hypothetical protein DMG39_27935 [Acidobacteriota bacterium]